MSDPLDVLVDLVLEQAVLGQIITFALFGAFDEAGLTADSFFRPQHRWIFDAARAIQDAGGQADIVTVGQQLRAVGQLDEVGAGYLAMLMDRGPVRPDTANVLLEVARLDELAARRAGYYALKHTVTELVTPGCADGALGKHLDAVQAIVERQHGEKAPAWLDVDAQLLAHQRETSVTTSQRVYFALPAIDDCIGGMRDGEVGGWLGRPGLGKTVMLAHIARAVSESSGHVFFSLEMPGAQIVGRIKQMLYGVGRHELERKTQNGELDDELYRRAFRNLVIVDAPNLSVAEMGRRLRRIANGPLKGIPISLVTIDHLGLVGGDRSLSTYDRVSAQSRDVKELAKRFGCAVLLAVQVSREAGGDGSRELGLGSARDSGVVEEAMDYMVGIRRLDRSLTLSPFARARYQDVIFAKVIKNRHGDPGSRETAYRFFPVGLRLEEDPHLHAEDDDIARIAATRGGRR